MAAWRKGGSGFGQHADEVGSFIAPPAGNFCTKDDQTTSSVKLHATKGPCRESEFIQSAGV